MYCSKKIKVKKKIQLKKKKSWRENIFLAKKKDSVLISMLSY